MRVGNSRARSTVVCLATWVVLGLFPAEAEVLPFGLKIEQALDGTAGVAALAQSPTGEIWVLERVTGTIRVLVAGVEDATLTIPVRSACGGLIDVAFAPHYADSGLALVSYVDPSGRLRVDRVVRRGGGLVLGTTLIEPGSTTGCRAGGGLAIGPDGTLYVGVGDLEDPGSAQDDARLGGKLLRINLDGSIPTDNPDPTSPVFAKGFRDAADLSLNPGSARANGTVYANDLGATGSAADEINAVVPGGNHGWDSVSGNSGGLFDDPLVAYQPPAGPKSIVTLRGAGLGEENRNSLVYTHLATDELRQAMLSGAELDTLQDTRTFFDPDGDPDGTPDVDCPTGFDSLFDGADGMLYAANSGANPGIWRVYRDEPGAREVSPPGSPFPLSIRKEAGALRISWEELSGLEAGRPARNGGQHAETYQVWEGTLPIGASYDHLVITRTDGIADGPATRSATVAAGGGSLYYLVSAQGDNLEGPTGRSTDGTPRDAVETDYCAAVGYGKFTGQCIDDFRHPVTGEPIRLVDYNPLSPTYLQALSVRDFRGRVVHIDVAAFDCFWCNLQAPTFHEVDVNFRGRDFVLITIMNASEFVPRPYDGPDACAAGIQDWVNQHNEHTPVLCDVDLDQDGLGDVSDQFWHGAIGDEACGGFSQNFFVDQGGVIFDYGCSFTPGSDVTTIIAPEINPEFCE